MKKRILSAILAAVCAASYLSFSALALDAETVSPDKIEAENYSEWYDATEADLSDTNFPLSAGRDQLKVENGGTGKQVAGTGHKNWLKYSNVDFGAGYSQFYANYSAKSGRCSTKSRLEVRIDDVDSKAVCALETPATDSGGWGIYQTVTADLTVTPYLTGVHDVYVYMLGEPDDETEHTCIGNFDYFGFEKASVAVESVALSKTKLALKPGGVETLTATVTPSYATDAAITWATSDKTVATVENGKVTAIKDGTAVITATTLSGKFAACTVTVKTQEAVTPTPPAVNVKSISLKTPKRTISAGKSVKLSAVVLPSGAANKSITWSTSKKSVATVSSSGVVKGIKAGKATITAASKANGAIKATVQITVQPKSVKITKATGKKGKVTVKFKKAPGAKKYSITIKNAKNKKIVSASTKKLTATVKSKKLKKGKYTVMISYKQNGITSAPAVKKLKILK